MIVAICRSNGIPQTMSGAGDIPGDVHAAALMPVEGAAAPPYLYIQAHMRLEPEQHITLIATVIFCYIFDSPRLC